MLRFVLAALLLDLAWSAPHFCPAAEPAPSPSDAEEQRDLEKALRRFQSIRPVATAKEMWHGHLGALAFSHDGRFLATAGGDQVCVWRTRDWSQVSCWPGHWAFRICFSPDDKWLYLSGGVDLPVHVRCDWRTGKVNRTYKAHKHGHLSGMELSADGRRMASADYLQVFHVCDTETGKILKSYQMQGLIHDFTFSPDGRTLLRATEFPKNAAGAGNQQEMVPGWVAETIDGKPLPFKDPSSKDGWWFSPAGRYLVSTRTPAPDATVQQVGQILCVHDADREFAEVASRHDDYFGQLLAISADGKRVAVGNLDRGGNRAEWRGVARQTLGVRFTVLTLPHLKPVSTCEVLAAQQWAWCSVALSPDGKTLAASLAYQRTPYLFDTDTGRRILPTRGHLDQIVDVFFPPDGTTLRTLDSQNFICRWDAVTLRLVNRFSFPPSFQVLSARPPDGKYLLCQDLADDGDSVPLKVVDSDTGGVMSSLVLPEWGRNDSPLFLWLNESETVLYIGKKLVRFDFRRGKVVQEIKTEKVSPGEDRLNHDPTVDGTEYRWIEGVPGFGPFEGWSVDLLTGKARSLGEKRLARFTGDRGGQVPGNRYFYVSDPGLYLLDRRTLDVAAEKPFRDLYLFDLAFSGDGGRCAVVTGEQNYVGAQLRRRNPKTQSLVRVYETRSGKAVAAFPTSTRLARCRLSPDGKRLVVINEDDTLESWDLSAGKPDDEKPGR